MVAEAKFKLLGVFNSHRLKINAHEVERWRVSGAQAPPPRTFLPLHTPWPCGFSLIKATSKEEEQEVCLK